MGIVFHGVPQELVLNLKQEYGLEVFVETGTFKGGTAVWAANNFKKVITTEFSQRFYDATKNQYGHIKNIDFLFGNSTEELKKILSSVQETCIFWLDAHWMGGGGISFSAS